MLGHLLCWESRKMTSSRVALEARERASLVFWLICSKVLECCTQICVSISNILQRSIAWRNLMVCSKGSYITRWLKLPCYFLSESQSLLKSQPKACDCWVKDTTVFFRGFLRRYEANWAGERFQHEQAQGIETSVTQRDLAFLYHKTYIFNSSSLTCRNWQVSTANQSAEVRSSGTTSNTLSYDWMRGTHSGRRCFEPVCPKFWAILDIGNESRPILHSLLFKQRRLAVICCLVEMFGLEIFVSRAASQTADGVEFPSGSNRSNLVLL